MAITLNQHKENITKKVIGRFSDSVAPKLGLSSWFPAEVTTSKQVSIEVERNRGLIAVDVERGTEGNMNTFGKHSEKIYVPPFFKEKFNFADLDVYERTFGSNMAPGANEYVSMLRTAGDKLNVLRNKILRAKEKQRAQALQTGIVEMKNGDSVDFKRKADALVDLGAGNYFGETGVDILNTIAEGVKFLKRDGKSASTTFDVICGSRAIGAIMNDEKILKKLDNQNINIGSLGTSRFDNTTGLVYHGRLVLRNGAIDLWTYEDTYENPDGSYSEYITDNNVVLLPRDFVGKHAHAGVPAIIRDKGNAELPEWISYEATEFYINNYVDPRAAAHMFEIMSAPLAIPFSVDRICTAKVLANA